MLTSITSAQFETALEAEEVLELSRLTDETNPNIDQEKVDFALERALGIMNSYYLTSSDCGKAFIKTQAAQLQIWIARFLLDTIKSRPFVQEDYDRAIKQLEYGCTECVNSCPLTDEEIKIILGTEKTSTGRLRASGGTNYCPKRVGRFDYTYLNRYNDYSKYKY